jgi:hypothetical protein
MQAGLMAASLESYVIDNDMLGSILKSLSVVEVSDATLALGQYCQTWCLAKGTSSVNPIRWLECRATFCIRRLQTVNHRRHGNRRVR